MCAVLLLPAHLVIVFVRSICHSHTLCFEQKVRLCALLCLEALTKLPYHILHAQRNEVLNGLLAAVDDNKRLVRKQAMRTRNEWYLHARRKLCEQCAHVH